MKILIALAGAICLGSVLAAPAAARSETIDSGGTPSSAGCRVIEGDGKMLIRLEGDVPSGVSFSVLRGKVRVGQIDGETGLLTDNEGSADDSYQLSALNGAETEPIACTPITRSRAQISEAGDRSSVSDEQGSSSKAVSSRARVAQPTTASNLVYGGEEVPTGERPYLVSILFKTKSNDGSHDHNLCSGSLIDPTHVLTAAHCIKGVYRGLDFWGDDVYNNIDITKDEVTVFAGGVAIRGANDSHKLKVVDYVIHPSYERLSHSFGADIAILELEIPHAEQTAKIAKPSGPPSPSVLDFSQEYLGYGRQSDVSDPGIANRKPHRGYGAMLPYFPTGVSPTISGVKTDDPNCFAYSGLNRNVFCLMMDPFVHGAACGGDSGGPVVVNGDQIVGTISTSLNAVDRNADGRIGCGEIFTIAAVDVWEQRCWIQENTDSVLFVLEDGTLSNELPENDCSQRDKDGEEVQCAEWLNDKAWEANQAQNQMANEAWRGALNAYNAEMKDFRNTPAYSSWEDTYDDAFDAAFRDLLKTLHISQMDQIEYIAGQLASVEAGAAPKDGMPEPPDASDPAYQPTLIDRSNCIKELVDDLGSRMTNDSCGRAYLGWYSYRLGDPSIEGTFNAYCNFEMGPWRRSLGLSWDAQRLREIRFLNHLNVDLTIETPDRYYNDVRIYDVYPTGIEYWRGTWTWQNYPDGGCWHYMPAGSGSFFTPMSPPGSTCGP